MISQTTIEEIRKIARANRGEIVKITHKWGWYLNGDDGAGHSEGELKYVWRNYLVLSHPDTGYKRKIEYSKIVNIEVISQ